MTPIRASQAAHDMPSRARSPWSRLGFAGFLFFLLKGLIWLLVPAALWTGC